MTKTPRAAPKAAPVKYDAGQLYDVQLTAIVPWKGRNLSPGKRTALRGDVIQALVEQHGPELIASATPAAEGGQ